MSKSEKMQDRFTKYETARILGARALQLSMDAPVLLKLDKEELENLRYDLIKIAELELNSEVLPITVKRPMPEKTGEKLVKVTEKKEEKTEEKDDKKIEKKEIEEEGEIMELAKPEDEVEEEAGSEEVGLE